MDSKKLFHVLVVGGALLGGASGCGDAVKSKPESSSDAGTTPQQSDGGTGGISDGGTGDDTGGGVQGW